MIMIMRYTCLYWGKNSYDHCIVFDQIYYSPELCVDWYVMVDVRTEYNGITHNPVFAWLYVNIWKYMMMGLCYDTDYLAVINYWNIMGKLG